MPTKIEIKPEIELVERVTDFDGNKVVITIATFDTPITSTPAVSIYSAAYLTYDTKDRPDYQDKALYYGAPELYPNKLTEEEMKKQMEYIKQNLENYKFKEL